MSYLGWLGCQRNGDVVQWLHCTRTRLILRISQSLKFPLNWSFYPGSFVTISHLTGLVWCDAIKNREFILQFSSFHSNVLPEFYLTTLSYLQSDTPPPPPKLANVLLDCNLIWVKNSFPFSENVSTMIYGNDFFPYLCFIIYVH